MLREAPVDRAALREGPAVLAEARAVLRGPPVALPEASAEWAALPAL
jgi:hypothetical protein